MFIPKSWLWTIVMLSLDQVVIINLYYYEFQTFHVSELINSEFWNCKRGIWNKLDAFSPYYRHNESHIGSLTQLLWRMLMLQSRSTAWTKTKCRRAFTHIRRKSLKRRSYNKWTKFSFRLVWWAILCSVNYPIRLQINNSY